MSKVILNFRGKEYKTLIDLARAYNIDYHLIIGRLSAGYSLEQAIRMGASTKEVTLYGVKYKSLVHLSKEIGIRYESLENRLAEGLTLEEAVDILINTEPIVFNGIKYPTLTALCMEYQIDLVNFRHRINLGWSTRDALLTPIRKTKRKNQIEYRGILYNSKRELAEHFGYTPSMLQVQGKILGLDFIPTLDFLNTFLANYKGNRPNLINKIPYVIYEQQWFPLLKDLCEYIGVEPLQLKTFRRNNPTTSVHDALTQMSELTKMRVIDNQTNEISTLKELEVKYKRDVRTLEREGYFMRVTVKAFPSMRFNKHLPFITPEATYKEILEQRANSNT